jgi:hypothetical protein
MELFITDYCKVQSVENGIVTVITKIPVEMLDEVIDLATHVLHAAKVLKIKARMVASTTVLSIPRFGGKNK